MASNFKHKPARSKKYMEWVTTLPCCLTGHRANDYLGTDPHHEPEPGHGTMGGKPCDSRCVPIRHDLHVLMETPGNSRLSVWARYNKQPEAEIERTRNMWLEQGGKKFW